jgi:hypothetical protein
MFSNLCEEYDLESWEYEINSLEHTLHILNSSPDSGVTNDVLEARFCIESGVASENLNF